jgi:hypothetical protein
MRREENSMLFAFASLYVPSRLKKIQKKEKKHEQKSKKRA